MKIYDTALAAKVAARNEVNTLANSSFVDAIEALRPFVGQKVCKVDGTLLEKVKRALPPAISANGSEAHTWYQANSYSLVLNVKTCACSKAPNATPQRDYQHAHYAETTLYLANLSGDGVLTSLYSYDARKTDYTEEFVRKARLEAEQARKAVSEAESKIHYFGMYD